MQFTKVLLDGRQHCQDAVVKNMSAVSKPLDKEHLRSMQQCRVLGPPKLQNNSLALLSVNFIVLSRSKYCDCYWLSFHIVDIKPRVNVYVSPITSQHLNSYQLIGTIKEKLFLKKVKLKQKRNKEQNSFHYFLPRTMTLGPLLWWIKLSSAWNSYSP